MSLAVKLEEKYTYRDYLNWPEGERWELIDGVPYNMSPAPSRWHQQMLLKLGRMIGDFLDGKPCEVNVAPFDVRLPDGDQTDEELDTVVQPDISVVCDPKKLDDRGCRGAPDLIVEILSESTASKDLNEKLRLYLRHGVREYWVVDLWSRTISVHLLQADGRYGPVALYNATDKLPSTVLDGFVVDLENAFKDIKA